MAGSQHPVGITTPIDRQSPATLVRDAFESWQLSAGTIDGFSVVHKFGRNSAVGTTFVPVAMGGAYRTPQTATTLRIKAGNANDTAAGSGARKVMIQGLDGTGALVSEELETNGISAGTASTNSFLRLFRAWVSESGTYATQTTGSHTADVVVEDSGGTDDWAVIDATDYPRGQTEVAAYTVPLTKTAYIMSISMSVDSTQPADLILLQRGSILDSAAPYDAMRMQIQYTGLASPASLKPKTPLGPYSALTDIVFMAKVGVSTGTVEVDFEILLLDD